MFRPGGKEGKMRQGFLKKFKEPGGLAGRILKWQTVTLANGMDFEVWRPVSVQHPDTFTLVESRIEDKLEESQEDAQLKFKLFGDSAYHPSEFITTA